jgi:hypothetical protein
MNISGIKLSICVTCIPLKDLTNPPFQRQAAIYREHFWGEEAPLACTPPPTRTGQNLPLTQSSRFAKRHVFE